MRQFRGNSPVTQSGCLQDVQPGPSLDLSWTVAPPRCRAPCGRTEMRSANTSVRIYTHCACTMRLPCPMVMRTCSIACATHKQSSMGTGKGPAHTHTSQSDTIRLYAFLQDRYGFFVLNMATHSTHTPHTTSPHEQTCLRSYDDHAPTRPDTLGGCCERTAPARRQPAQPLDCPSAPLLPLSAATALHHSSRTWRLHGAVPQRRTAALPPRYK